MVRSSVIALGGSVAALAQSTNLGRKVQRLEAIGGQGSQQQRIQLGNLNILDMMAFDADQVVMRVEVAVIAGA